MRKRCEKCTYSNRKEELNGKRRKQINLTNIGTDDNIKELDKSQTKYLGRVQRQELLLREHERRRWEGRWQVCKGKTTLHVGGLDHEMDWKKSQWTMKMQGRKWRLSMC